MKNFLLLSFMLLQLTLLAQGGTEILLFDMHIKNGAVFLENGKNITSRKGYDNQPFFYKSNVYFSSADSNQNDIKIYNYITHTSTTFTKTADNEFSPTVTPDKKFISCILQQKDGTQDLIKYSLNSGKPVPLIENLTVGYHAWIDNNSLLLFILEDTVTFNLHQYNIKTREDKIISNNIGRSIHQIPGGKYMSFVEKVSDKEWLIKRFDPVSKTITTIATALPGRDHLTWTRNGWILMSDGTDIFCYKPGQSTAWSKVKIANAALTIKGITRLAVNETNNKIAIVVAE